METTPPPSSTTSGERSPDSFRWKSGIVGLLAALALFATSCTGPATAPLDIVVPLDPITIDLPSLDVDLGVCTATIALPSIVVSGLAFEIPELFVDPDLGVVSLPSIGLSAPASSSSFDGIEASCLGLPPAVLGINITIPAIAAGGAVTVDFGARQLVVDALLIEVTGGSVDFPDLGGLVLPLPEISIPLDGAVVPF